MPKKTLIVLLAALLLASCVSVSNSPGAPASQQDFITATLPPTKTAAASSTPTTAPAATGTASPAVTAPANCTHAAVLLRDVTIPDYAQVEAGETFVKTWEFLNTGTCPWNGLTVKFASGDDLHAPLSAPMPAAAPKEKVQLSMELTAPAKDGSYSGYFTLLDANGRAIPIGGEASFWVKFRVGSAASVPAAPGAAPALPGNCSHGPNANYVSEIVSLINSARANAGMPALTLNAEISAFSQHHAEDMAYNNFLSHDGSDGNFGERMAGFNQTHTGFVIGGEILAIGTAQDAMSQWARDEHWNFVMSESTLIGAGYAYNSCSDYGGYFTVDFGY